MGEAKRRGSTSERIQQAQDNKYAGLLGLTVAITGKEIDLDTVQILDPEAFGKIANWMMQGLGEAVKNKSLNLNVFTSAGWVQDDGSLIVRLIHKNTVNDEFRIPKEQWHLATAEAIQQASLNASTPEGAELVKKLGELALDMQAKAQAAPPKPTPKDIDELVDCMFVVIGREPAGVHFLNSMAKDNPFLTNAADVWIADGAKYFTIPLDRQQGLDVPQVAFAKDETQLMAILAKQAAASPNIARTGLSLTGVAADVKKAAFDFWAGSSGNVVLLKG